MPGLRIINLTNMAKAKKVVEEVSKEMKKKVEAVEWSVFTEKGDFIRTYSLEDQGKDAEKLALGYAVKINGYVK